MYDVKKCKMSEYGRNTFKGSSRQMVEGTIVGETKDGKCFKVLWPGLKSPRVYHKNFFEIIEEEQSNILEVNKIVNTENEKVFVPA